MLLCVMTPLSGHRVLLSLLSLFSCPKVPLPQDLPTGHSGKSLSWLWSLCVSTLTSAPGASTVCSLVHLLPDVDSSQIKSFELQPLCNLQNDFQLQQTLPPGSLSTLYLFLTPSLLKVKPSLSSYPPGPAFRSSSW